MSYTSSLREVRAYFALTQAELASWLGLSRSLLALVETDREALPTHARPWLRPWTVALDLPDTSRPLPAAGVDSPEAGPGPDPVRARLAECHYQACRLHQQELALLTRHRTATRRLAAGPLLLAALPAPAATEATVLALRRRWVARLLEEATDTLLPENPTGPVAAALLGIRRRAYLHEAAGLRAYLAGAAPQ